MDENTENKNIINFVRRTNRNNTHLGIVDHSIKEISTWKKDSHKFNRYLVMGFFSLGILFIVSLIWKSLYISLVCVESDILTADYFMIIDDMEKKHVQRIVRENFYKKCLRLKNFSNKEFSKKDVTASPYLGKDFLNKTQDTITLYYKNNKYIYIETERCLKPVIFEIESFKNEEIHQKLGLRRKGNGIGSIEEYNYLLNKFGKNKIELRQKNLCIFFLQNLVGPFFIYQLYSIIVWIFDEYYQFAIITSAFSLIILVINSIYSYKNYHRILNFNHTSPATISRDFKLINLAENLENMKNRRRSTIDVSARAIKRKSTMLLSDDADKNEINKFFKSVYDAVEIVPGDILELGSNDLIPCDCILIEGYCNVNESDLTGESSLVMKIPLPMDKNNFSFDNNRKSILYHGTKINKCESDLNKFNSNTIYVLALNTGYNTNRGNLVQNLLFPKSTNFKFYNDIKIFFITMTVVWFLTNSYMIYLYYRNKWEKIDLIVKIFANLTVILPPILPICMVFTSFYFHWNLSRKNISCISDRKMNAAGRVNIIVLDKTGTLTEENLEIHGFQMTLPKKNVNNSIQADLSLEFDEITTDAVIMNKVHKNFWKNYCNNPNNQIFENYKNNPLNNLIYFVECLVTCHSIDKMKNDLLANSIDKKIFEKFKWSIEKFFENDEMKYYIIPKNSYKITEKLIFNNNLNTLMGKKYKLTIIKRFEFSSKFQSMSVIVKNELDDSYRFFIKGAPEKIIRMCNPNSIPDNFDEKQMEHTKNGFRVLACATKSLEYSEVFHHKMEKEEEEKKRKKYENNLVFLGFIIFSNKLKRDTKHVIANLKNSNCKLLMATGDNPFTSISVARECEMIEFLRIPTYIIDLEKDDENVERLTLFSLNKNNTVKDIDNKMVNLKISNFDSSVNLSSRKETAIRKKLSLKPNNPYNNKAQANNLALTNRLSRGNSSRPLNEKGQGPDLVLTRKASIITGNKKKTLHNSESNSNITGRLGNDKKPYRHRFYNTGGNLQFPKNYENEFRATIKRIINSEIFLCVSGKSFNYLYMQYKQDKTDGNYKEDSLNSLMMKLIRNQAIIFYRMSPNDKIDLINFIKEDSENIVAMCGDGANDCGALLTADIGISVRHSSGNSVTSHFYSSEESISCVELIIRNGRACLENSVVLIKYMLIYGFIQLTTVLLLYMVDLDMSLSQYIYSDTFIAGATSLLAIKTGTGYVLIKESPPNSILNCRFISSILGQIIIQVLSQIIYFWFFITFRVDIEKDRSDFKNNQDILYLFVYTAFQSMFILFIFNSFSKHRKDFYTNKYYIFYVSALILFTMSFVSVYFEKFPVAVVFVKLEDYSRKDYEILSETNRLFTLIAVVINLLLTYAYEFSIEFLFMLRDRKKENRLNIK